MTEKMRKLVELNKQEKTIEKQEIVREIKKNFDTNDEIAILRKMVVVLANKVKEQHPEIDLSELLEYDNYVNGCKEKAKHNINIEK